MQINLDDYIRNESSRLYGKKNGFRQKSRNSWERKKNKKQKKKKKRIQGERREKVGRKKEHGWGGKNKRKKLNGERKKEQETAGAEGEGEVM